MLPLYKNRFQIVADWFITLVFKRDTSKLVMALPGAPVIHKTQNTVSSGAKYSLYLIYRNQDCQ